jgi:hypothetical protein
VPKISDISFTGDQNTFQKTSNAWKFLHITGTSSSHRSVIRGWITFNKIGYWGFKFGTV